MRFGAFVPQGWRMDLVGIDPADHWSTMAGIAGRLEAVGYDSLWVYDHFHTVPKPTQEPTYEAWTLMSALAVATETIRLGQMCTCNSYRPPAYLAKVAASIDVISAGRLEMGIGAGWYEHEYLGYGYEFPKPSVRIGMLGEAVEIMKRMWTEDEVHFDGKYYTLKGAICSPKPVQEPHVPIWVAGGGEQLTLRVAARHADYTNFGGGMLDVFNHKSDVLRGHCETVGRDFSEITRSASFNVICAETEADARDRFETLKDQYRSSMDDDWLDSFESQWLIGTPEQLIETFRPWDDAGMGYAILYFGNAAHDALGYELFAEQVIPAFR